MDLLLAPIKNILKIKPIKTIALMLTRKNGLKYSAIFKRTIRRIIKFRIKSPVNFFLDQTFTVFLYFEIIPNKIFRFFFMTSFWQKNLQPRI